MKVGDYIKVDRVEDDGMSPGYSHPMEYLVGNNYEVIIITDSMDHSFEEYAIQDSGLTWWIREDWCHKVESPVPQSSTEQALTSIEEEGLSKVKEDHYETNIMDEIRRSCGG